MENEDKVLEALNQSPKRFKIGSRSYCFRPLSLADRQEMSAIQSKMAGVDYSGMTEQEMYYEAVRLGSEGRKLAMYIAVGAHVRGFMSGFRRWLLFRDVWRNASSTEWVSMFLHITGQINAAFFLTCITSLSRNGILKETKGT